MPSAVRKGVGRAWADKGIPVGFPWSNFLKGAVPEPQDRGMSGTQNVLIFN